MIGDFMYQRDDWFNILNSSSKMDAVGISFENQAEIWNKMIDV